MRKNIKYIDIFDCIAIFYLYYVSVIFSVTIEKGVTPKLVWSLLFCICGTIVILYTYIIVE